MQVVNVTAENGSHLQTWCPVLLKRSVQLLTLHISGRNDYPFWTRLWDYRLKITGICIISYTVIFMATTRVPLESICLLWPPALAHVAWWKWAFYTPHSAFAKPAKQEKGGPFSARAFVYCKWITESVDGDHTVLTICLVIVHLWNINQYERPGCPAPPLNCYHFDAVLLQ